MKKKLISIFIPCYNEEKNISLAYQTLTKTTNTIRNYIFEFIFIDNGSTDGTKKEIRNVAAKDKRAKGVFLSRNFGPESSIQAGFDNARGDAVIGFPCDLQEPTSLIPQFINKWEEGYDSVLGVYMKIEDPLWMIFLRKSFYIIMKHISDIEIPVQSSGYGLMSRRVVDVMNTLPETYRISRGILAWVGFKTAYVTYERKKRMCGKSSYNFFAYIKHAQRSVFGFSYFPLDLLIYFGLLLVLLSFLFIIGYIFFIFLFGNPIKGAVTIVVAIIFFGGVNLLALSIIGKYIQVIVEETKKRPLYIVDAVIGKRQKIYEKK